MAVTNLTGGPCQKEGEPPVTAVVMGMPEAKPVAVWGVSQHMRMQSFGYCSSYAHGGAGWPLAQSDVAGEVFSGVPGTEVMKLRVAVWKAQFQGAIRSKRRRKG